MLVSVDALESKGGSVSEWFEVKGVGGEDRRRANLCTGFEAEALPSLRLSGLRPPIAKVAVFVLSL